MKALYVKQKYILYVINSIHWNGQTSELKCYLNYFNLKESKNVLYEVII